MPTLRGYQLESLLYDGQNSRVYRATRERDGRRVVVKLPRSGRFAQQRRARLRHEFEILRQLDDPAVIKALGLERFDGGEALILEDFGGVSLRERGRGDEPMAVGEFLRLALRITAGLAVIHARGVVHRDIKPSNILMNPASGRVAIADFSIASQLSRERQGLAGASALEGTLAYMSPEQTGRMNRSVDYRSDYYSLGVTCYQLLTCSVPFAFDDPAALVHAHIAREPEEPRARRPGLPRALSELVLKLMAKSAERRYQSARGITADLERCLAAWEAGGGIEPFTLGREDRSERFQIPERLYGRDEALAELRAAFERCAAGAVELALVAGAPGIGKSALAHELLRVISERRGMFGAGKFDQLSGGTPHSALTHALREVCQQLQSEPEERLVEWRARLSSALGENRAALTALVPEISALLEEGASASRLSAAEANNRLRLGLAQALRTLASADRPLVLLLDDLQWAEPPTLQLIEQLLTSPGLSNLLLLGAYRDNEVDDAHPLRTTLGRLRERGVAMSMRALGPLERDDVRALTGATLSPTAREPSAVASLADYLRELTAGNPFFLRVVLRALHERGLLRFVGARGGWSWALEQIRVAALPDDLGAFMSARLCELSARARETLEFAASIGNEFHLELLARALDRDAALVAEDLLEAARRGLVRPLGNAYKYVAHAGADAGAPIRYHFQHDRVQQAARALIPASSLPGVHHKLGRLLLERGVELPEELLFTLTQHLNSAAALIEEPGDRLRLAEFNLEAGRRAQRSSAWALARAHYREGIGLLPQGAWARRHELAYALHVGLAEVTVHEATDASLRRARDLLSTLERHARTPLERARLGDLRFKTAFQSARFDECLSAAQDSLEALGYRAPRSGAASVVLRELASARWRLRRLDLQRYLAGPRLDDPELEHAMQMYIYAWQAAQHVDDRLGPVALLRIANETLRRGLSDYSTLGLAGLAVIMVSGLGAYQQAARLSEVATTLALQGGKPYPDATALVYLGTVVAPWGGSLAAANDLITRGHERARGGALLQEQHYYSSWDGVYRWFRGVPLGELRAFTGPRLQEAMDYFMESRGAMSPMLFVDRCARSLMGETSAPFELSSETWSEREYVEFLNGEGTALYLAIYALLKAELAAVAGDFAAARRWIAERARHETPVLRNTVMSQRLDFIDGLSAAALAHDAAPSRRRALLRTLRRAVRRSERAAELRRDNFGGHHLLLTAERARLSGLHGQARQRYDQAIEHARAQRNRRLEALALERAARCSLAAGHELVGELYLREARDAYERWGARAKVERLREEFPVHFASDAGSETVSSISTSSTSRSLSESLDLAALLKASRALSSELQLDKLLRRLLELVLENAGAQRGALLLMREGALRVEAECEIVRASERAVRVLESRAPGARECRALIEFVARTRRDVLLDDATRDGEFTGDPYILEHRPRALLCTPILHQGALQGVLYLENRLTGGAFTGPQLMLLKQLAAQSASSIENARLYERVNRISRSYSRFVPHRFLEIIGKPQITELRLGDQIQRDMTVLFADIRGFSTLSEAMSPADNFVFINDYLQAIAPSIERSGGFIDKYIGDAIMALFPDSADSALAAARDVLEALAAFNAQRAERGAPPVQIGIGLNSGPLMLGTVGHGERMDCTVISDVVNVASRLEGLTKQHQTPIILSGETRRRLSPGARALTREIGRARVRGRTSEVRLYALTEVDAG